MPLDFETLVDLYRDMWTIRAFEQGLEREFKKGNVPGMLHTGLGHAAVKYYGPGGPGAKPLLLASKNPTHVELGS